MTFILTIKAIPSNAGKQRFIIKRLKVAANILMSFVLKNPHIKMAISPLATKPIKGGKGTLV